MLKPPGLSDIPFINEEIGYKNSNIWRRLVLFQQEIEALPLRQPLSAGLLRRNAVSSTAFTSTEISMLVKIINDVDVDYEAIHFE